MVCIMNLKLYCIFSSGRSYREVLESRPQFEEISVYQTTQMTSPVVSPAEWPELQEDVTDLNRCVLRSLI